MDKFRRETSVHGFSLRLHKLDSGHTTTKVAQKEVSRVAIRQTNNKRFGIGLQLDSKANHQRFPQCSAEVRVSTSNADSVSKMRDCKGRSVSNHESFSYDHAVL